MNRHYGIIKDGETLLTTVNVEDKNALAFIQRQVAMWHNIFTDSHLRIAKIKRFSGNGWEEA